MDLQANKNKIKQSLPLQWYLGYLGYLGPWQFGSMAIGDNHCSGHTAADATEKGNNSKIQILKLKEQRVFIKYKIKN